MLSTRGDQRGYIRTIPERGAPNADDGVIFAPDIPMFSKACMYAIRAMVLMASSGVRTSRWTLGEIVEGTGAPAPFMAKILQRLVHAGIIRSVKGPGGGFEPVPARFKHLKLGEVVSVIDEDVLLRGCALGFPKCDDRRPCPIHHQVLAVREHLQALLTDTLIKELGMDLHEGGSFLKGKT